MGPFTLTGGEGGGGEGEEGGREGAATFFQLVSIQPESSGIPSFVLLPSLPLSAAMEIC